MTHIAGKLEKSIRGSMHNCAKNGRIYRWLKKDMKEGIERLLPKSKRPKNPRKIGDEIKELDKYRKYCI